MNKKNNKGKTNIGSGRPVQSIVDVGASYTPPSSEAGKALVPIKFLEENLYKITVDNKDAVGAEYYKVGVGWHELNEQAPGGFLSAASQQKNWHEFLNKNVTDNGTRNYEYVPGASNRKGLYVEGAMGSEGSLYVTDRTRVSAAVEAGLELTTVDPQANNAYVNAQVNFDYQSDKESFAYRASIKNETKYYHRSSAPINSTKVSLQIGQESFSCGMGLTMKVTNPGVNYVKYDNDTDQVSEVFCQSKF